MHRHVNACNTQQALAQEADYPARGCTRGRWPQSTTRTGGLNCSLWCTQVQPRNHQRNIVLSCWSALRRKAAWKRKAALTLISKGRPPRCLPSFKEDGRFSMSPKLPSGPCSIRKMTACQSDSSSNSSCPSGAAISSPPASRRDVGWAHCPSLARRSFCSCSNLTLSSDCRLVAGSSSAGRGGWTAHECQSC